MDKTLRTFKFQRILNSDTSRKSLNLLGTINEQPAILIAEKTFFNVVDLATFVDPTQGLQEINLLESNDIYHWFLASQHQDADQFAGTKVNLIYPCTDTHIRKYSAQIPRLVVETPDVYERYVKKYIEEKKAGGRLNWVDNILTHKVEADRIVYEDGDAVDGFILLPDLKWDRKTAESMYLMALARRSDVSTVRDFTPEHIPYLRHLRSSILTAVEEKFKVEADQLKIYFHYQPSYYHLHLHVVHIRHDMGNSAAAGKAMLIENVIEMLEGMKGGVKKGMMDVDIAYVVGEEHELWRKVFGRLKVGEEPTV